MDPILRVEDSEDGLRLDVFLRRRDPRLTRARSKMLIAEGHVRVDGRRAKKGARLVAGQSVEVQEVELDVVAVANAHLPLFVCYEDTDCVVVDKPAGQAMHPLQAGDDQTLCSALLAHYPEMAGVGYGAREPGILHRLDTNTSG
ncbi:MAG: S4 domain-containing protein, partial [Myxococcota bacterium]